MTTKTFEVVGLIPAAGYARRLALSTGSKELLPVPDQTNANMQEPIAAGLVRQMQAADCARVFFITRSDKADIAQTFGGGARYNIPIGYLMIEDSWGPPFTLASAFAFAPGAGFAFGFPDIMIEPADSMAQIVTHLRGSRADVVIGTFPAQANQGVDLVTTDHDKLVTGVMPKEENPDWPRNGKTWLLAAWRPSFTAFFASTLDKLREQMTSKHGNREPSSQPDLPTGKVFSNALLAGLRIECVHFPHGRFLAIGSPDRLALAANFYQTSSFQHDHPPFTLLWSRWICF